MPGMIGGPPDPPAVQQPVQQPGELRGCRDGSPMYLKRLTCGNWTPTHMCEHDYLNWGSSGRRFKSCQPDQDYRRSNGQWALASPNRLDTPGGK